MHDPPRLGTSFSGIEGFGLGFTLAGWRLEWTGEIDKHASQVLAKRFSGAPNTGDITHVAPERLGSVDCYAFGFPCQDLSVAGHRAGLAGTRSGLFWEALHVLAAKKPKWFVAENVPGLLSSNNGEDFGCVLWALACLGYGVAYAVLDAQHFGVPQRRRRVFIVGCLGDEASARKVLADAPGGYRHPAPSGGEGRDIAGRTARGADTFGTLRSNPRNNSDPASDPLVWDTITARTGKGVDSDARGRVRAPTAGSLTASRKGAGSAFGEPVAHTLRGEGCDASEDGSKRGTPIVFDTQQDPINGGLAGALSGRGRQGVTDQRGHSPRPENLQPRSAGGSAPDDGSGQGQRRPPLAPLDAVGDGAPAGVPRWMDLPMWQGATESRALCLDRQATRTHSGEESSQGKRSEERGTMDGGRGPVAREPRQAGPDVDDGNRHGRKGGGRL